MAYLRDGIPGYDAWKTRAPEDEPGYWNGEEENGGEEVEMCDACNVELGAGDCQNCFMASEEDLLEDYP